MKNFKQVILIILALSLCLSLTACGIGGGDESTPKPQESPTPTVGSTPTEASTPQPVEPSSPESNEPSSPETNEPSTPEASVPVTPPASSPETSGNDPQGKESEPQGKESTPDASDTVPVESTPSQTRDDPLPVATDDLTSEQMTEIENVFGQEIDWDRLYFGTHKGYVIFGVTDDSGKYFRAECDFLLATFGRASNVYAYKDGVISELKPLVNAGEKNVFNYLEGFYISVIASRKTIEYLPDPEADLTEEEQKVVKKMFYGKYKEGFVDGEFNNTGSDTVVYVNGRSYRILMVDVTLHRNNGNKLSFEDAIKQGLLSDSDAINVILAANICFYYDNLVPNYIDQPN